MMGRSAMENKGKGENRKDENLLTLIQLDGNGYLNHKTDPFIICNIALSKIALWL